MYNFVIVVDGEVAGNIPINIPANINEDMAFALQGIVAALSSNPTIIPHERVKIGYLWNGKSFVESGE